MTKIIKKVCRLSLKLIYPAMRLYWYLVRPRTEGVKALILRNNTELLLVRHSYTPEKYSLPGGGVKRGESAEVALRREIQEEIGLDTVSLGFMGRVVSEREFKHDEISVYRVLCNGNIQIDEVEIIEAGYFPLSALPPVHLSVEEAIKLLRFESNDPKRS